MMKTVIIIPSRLEAVRLPNKPLELINNKEMILHVYEAAKKTNTGEVYVATPDQKIIDIIKEEKYKCLHELRKIKEVISISFLKAKTSASLLVGTSWN